MKFSWFEVVKKILKSLGVICFNFDLFMIMEIDLLKKVIIFCWGFVFSNFK